MRELSTVKKFGETSPELYKVFKDYADHVRSTRGAKGKTFSDKSLDDKEKVINKLFAEEVAKRSKISVKEYDGDIMHYSMNPVVKSFADAIKDQMIDMILPETLFGSLGLIADIRFADWGDSLSFDIENNGLYTVSKAGYRQRTAPAQRLEDTTVTLAPVNHEVTTYVTLFEILADRKSIAKEIMKIVRSIESEMLVESYNAFVAATENDVIPTKLRVDNYEEKELIRLCETVTAWNGGRKAVIVGTPSALKSVLPSELNIRILLDDEYVKTGYLPNFNGYDVIPMAQVADWASTDYSLKLDDKKIFIISPASDKIIKIGVGGTLSHQANLYDNANLQVQHTTTKAWDTQCITNSIAGVIELA